MKDVRLILKEYLVPIDKANKEGFDLYGFFKDVVFVDYYWDKDNDKEYVRVVCECFVGDVEEYRYHFSCVEIGDDVPDGECAGVITDDGEHLFYWICMD